MDAGMYRETDLEIQSKQIEVTLHLKQNRLWDYRHMMRTHMIQAVLIEQHLYLDLPEPFNSPSVAYPYIVTIDKSSKKVLSIRRNWNDGDPFICKKRTLC